jgi:hypothetical protein
MVARLPLTTPSSMGYFYSPELARGCDQLLAAAWDLIFVHCSSVAQYVEHVRDVPKILDFGDMDSQKWLEYANYKPFRCRSATGWKATRCWPPRSAWPAFRPVYGDHARRVGDARTTTAPGRRPTGSQRRRRDFFCPSTSPMTPTRSASSGAWTTTRTRSAWRASARRCGRLLRRVVRPTEAADRRCRSVARNAQTGRLPGVTVTGSVPDVRPFIRGRR